MPYSEISKDNQNHTWSKYVLKEKPFPEGNAFPWAVRLVYKTRTHHDNLQTNLHIYVTNITTIDSLTQYTSNGENDEGKSECSPTPSGLQRAPLTLPPPVLLLTLV